MGTIRDWIVHYGENFSSKSITTYSIELRNTLKICGVFSCDRNSVKRKLAAGRFIVITVLLTWVWIISTLACPEININIRYIFQHWNVRNEFFVHNFNEPNNQVSNCTAGMAWSKSIARCQFYHRAVISEKTTNWKITKTYALLWHEHGTWGLKVSAIDEYKHSRIY